ncbi:MAG TPA: rhomboid family intramembrane serine protease [Acidimicrobiales bacterium]
MLVTNLVVAVNLGLFVYGIILEPSAFGSAIGPLQRNFGLFGPAVADGEWYRLVTSGFVHFGLIHVGMNMLFIWQAGQLLEPGLGRLRFTLLYFASLLGGAAGALILTPNSLTAGASGAAFGLLGAAVVGLRQRGVPIMSTSLGTVLVLNLVLTFAISGISVGGHLGGLVAGGVCGAAILAPRAERRRALEIGVPIAMIFVAVVVALVAANASVG